MNVCGPVSALLKYWNNIQSIHLFIKVSGFLFMVVTLPHFITHS